MRFAGNGELLSTTVCLCAYMPVRMLALLGEHSDVVTDAFLIHTPSFASLSRFGVLSQGTFPVKPIKSYRWSSVKIKITLSGVAPGFLIIASALFC